MQSTAQQIESIFYNKFVWSIFLKKNQTIVLYTWNYYNILSQLTSIFNLKKKETFNCRWGEQQHKHICFRGFPNNAELYLSPMFPESRYSWEIHSEKGQTPRVTLASQGFLKTWIRLAHSHLSLGLLVCLLFSKTEVFSEMVSTKEHLPYCDSLRPTISWSSSAACFLSVPGSFTVC